MVAVAVTGVGLPGPAQARMKLAVEVNGTGVRLPLRAIEPLQPPEAVQEVAFVEDQVKVAVLPDVTVDGEGVSETVGAGGVTVTVAVAAAGVVPTAPAQVKI